MKYLIAGIIAFLAIAAAAEEWKPIVDLEGNIKMNEECSQESPLSEEQAMQMQTSELPDEKEVHEHVLCLVKKGGLFTEEHGFNADRLVAQFAAMNRATERVRNIIATCVASSDPNDKPAIRAFRDVRCLLRNKIKEY